MSRNSPSSAWTRREALGMLGAGIGMATFPAHAAQAQLAFPPDAIIRTVLKDYAPQELAGAATLFHEHLSLADDFMTRWVAYATQARAVNEGNRAKAAAPASPNQRASGSAPTAPFFMRNVELMSDEMRIAKTEGIGCVVDGGHPDMGRNVHFLRQVSKQSGMPIVAAGGFYTQPFYPAEIATMSEEQLVQALIQQVEADPIGAFGEIGSWDDMTKDERKVFRAVGKAHLATNLPIFTHTGIPGKAALEQLDLLEDAGVKPNRVVIGHLGNLVDPKVQVHKAICRRGAFVGFDRQGGPSDAQQVPMVMALIEAGFVDNLMFSADIASAAALKRNKGTGYAKTLTVFVPKLKAAGASDEALRQIMQDNPRRFLAFAPKVKRKD